MAAPALRAVGVTCGIGSLLVGARQAGFSVVGNVEWRKYYHHADEHGRNTFRENFPDATFTTSLDHLETDKLERLMGVELALGHPECGNFSILSSANKRRLENMLDPADIPLFVDIVGKLRPRFFIMDDLPKSFLAYPMQKYAEGLPGYDLFPEMISNWGYGNVQKNRDRMFMIGSLKGERWAFRPGERENTLTVRDVLDDLPEPRRGANVPNHDPHCLTSDCSYAQHMFARGQRATWGEAAEYFRGKPSGHMLMYPRGDGVMAPRLGFTKGHWDSYSHVLIGTCPIIHAVRCEPYTIRERARIQGFPDDFVFYGTRLNERGEWDHCDNAPVVKQTGKAMPVQFARYVSEQVAAHIQKKKFSSSGRRIIKPNGYVDEAKQWYCQNVGYSDQQAACSSCWLYDRCTIRRDKYGLGVPRGAPGVRVGSPARRAQQK